jgi:hypothetical protein
MLKVKNLVTEYWKVNTRNLSVTIALKQKIFRNGRLTFIKNGKRPTSHRSTTYLCYVPILEDFVGAGRVGLAGANIQSFYIFARKYHI